MEKENLAWLQEQCRESERLAEGMVDILESFEVGITCQVVCVARQIRV